MTLQERLARLTEYLLENGFVDSPETLKATADELDRLQAEILLNHAAIDRLQAENEALRKECDWALSKARVTHGVYQELHSLRPAQEALRADAERYRWLRECHWQDEPMKNGQLLHGDDLDAAIDAAMKEQKP